MIMMILGTSESRLNKQNHYTEDTSFWCYRHTADIWPKPLYRGHIIFVLQAHS